MNVRRTSVEDVVSNTCSQPSAQLLLPPLLKFPMDLFLTVWEHLPHYSRVCLILTCRQLYAVHHLALKDVSYATPATRLQRLFLLRRLQRDSVDLAFLCHGCLKFHAAPASRGLEEKDACDKAKGSFHLFTNAGFPYCNSEFALALENVQSRLASPADRGAAYYRGFCRSAMSMSYDVIIDANEQGKHMTTNYSYSAPSREVLQRSQTKTSRHPCDYARFLRSTNLQFCNHMWFGDDFVPGDGSVNDTLETTAIVTEVVRSVSPGAAQSYKCVWPDFCCLQCRVYVVVEAHNLESITIRARRVFEPPVRAGERPARLDRIERSICDPERFREECIERHMWQSMSGNH
jgi:hypothetical protein